MSPYLYAYHRMADGRIIHARTLAAAIRKSRDLQESVFIGTTLRGFMSHVSDFRREVSDFFASEISRRSKAEPRGRKDCDDWFFAARRTADKINGRRVVCTENECPRELRARLSHRLS